MYKVLNENNEPAIGKISWNKKYNLDDNEWKNKYRSSCSHVTKAIIQTHKSVNE